MKQIAVLLDDRVGAVAELTRQLAASGVNIESMSVEACGDTGVAVISVDRYDHAIRVLHDAGLKSLSQDTIVVRIEDEPGALAKVVSRIGKGGLDIRSIRFLCRDNGVAIAAIVTDKNDLAAAIVKDILVM